MCFFLFPSLSDAQHGGSTNAFTATEHTNYYFDVNTDCFEEALDRCVLFSFSWIVIHIPGSVRLMASLCNIRFAQFFIKPLMSADATTREIKAVDSGQLYF